MNVENFQCANAPETTCRDSLGGDSGGVTTTWPKVRLADYVNLLAGFPFKSQQFTGNQNDIALVKGENVSQGCILWGISKRWPVSDWEKMEKFHLLPGDVVIAMDRPWVPAGLKWSFIRDGDPKSLLVQRCARLRSNNSRLDQNFLRFVIGSPGFESYVKPITTGVNVPHISGQQILDFEFKLPPLAVQRRIAGILSAYDELIENSQRRIRILEEMARSLYREWFVHFRFPGHENHPLVPSSLGDIPQGWDVKRVPECVDINPRVVVPRDGEKPFVPMGCLSNDSMLISNIESREGNSGAKFQNGDTLFARITPCLENGKTGFVQFLPDAKAVGFGSTEFIVLRSRTLTPEFVYLLARSDEFRGVAIKSMSGASGRQRVQERCFADFQIVQPPLVLLNLFSAIVVPSFRNIYKLQLQIQNLHRTRNLLLNRLLSGQVELKIEDL
jgi:type I restriction enzyme S subunit